MDRYAVVGNPVAHSKSPRIHEAFARATGQAMTYERLLAPIGGFAQVAEGFARAGGKGLNVTVPFKLDALAIAHSASERARAAGACNTLKRDGDRWYADNTDGAGIVRDLTVNRGVALAGRDVLVLGAGGAARGILLPMLGQDVRSIVISNRTPGKAEALAVQFAAHGPLDALAPDRIGARTFDVVVNATSAGLDGGDTGWSWPAGLFRTGAFAYDLVYADGTTAFLRWAQGQGVTRTADGIGMLIEQAAESFLLWRGVRPQTAPVFELLRPGK
ncbi:MAG: shikimate dehydrogenase [Burkholderiales bacterium]|nr:shikimate dehydrogenase [Burkholderiales bacterium]